MFGRWLGGSVDAGLLEVCDGVGELSGGAVVVVAAVGEGDLGAAVLLGVGDGVGETLALGAGENVVTVMVTIGAGECRCA